jgi:WD40 repeat protein
MAPRRRIMLTALGTTAMLMSGMVSLASAASATSPISGMYPISARLGTPGAELWVKRYNGPGNSGDYALALAVSPDGSKVFVTGHSTGKTSFFDYATAAYDVSTEARLWVARYNGPGNNNDYADALSVSPDGSVVFVTGYSSGKTDKFDYATAAYDASTGARLWLTRYDGPGSGYDSTAALGVSPDGSRVFVTGASDDMTGFHGYATVAYDASTGAQQWVARYDGPGQGEDDASALGVSPDGSEVFVTGQSTVTTDNLDYATVAYNSSTGAQLWVGDYNGPANSADSPYALAVSPDGSRVFVTGYSIGTTSGYDYATVAMDASTGARVWVRRYNGPGDAADIDYALAVSPDGSRVFVTGYSTGTTSESDYATVAYDCSTGAQLWVRHYNGAANGADGASSLRVSPDGSKVFVTGTSDGSAGTSDYATLSYDASTGAALWVRRYNGPANGIDDAFVVGVNPQGSEVFVTGYSTGSTSDYDYATVAYSAA